MIRYVQKCEELIAFSCALGCHIFRCTCTLFVLSWHAVLWADVIYVAKVYYEQGWYTTGKLRTGVRAIWIACSVHSVSYLPGPQVSLTVTGYVLRGILAFTDPPPCQPLFASQEMERGIFKTYMDYMLISSPGHNQTKC